MTATARKMVQCLCQSFEFGEFDGENEAAISYDTNCNQTTTKTFAQGHDAKLVGYLVRADLAGEEMRIVEGGVAITFPGPVEAAGHVSEALAAKAQAQLDAARARIAKKAAREAAKTARKSAKAATAAEAPRVVAPVESQIKVGRWTYTAMVNLVSGEAVFTAKSGVERTLGRGEYTLLDN
jgi:hypothetical protein